ncbi:hypothetical protein TNCV_2858071 [Trichonephila clavipes]|nr:hypothetical protein TNCV_2858071 [Trichonephila clavipes]
MRDFCKSPLSLEPGSGCEDVILAGIPLSNLPPRTIVMALSFDIFNVQQHFYTVDLLWYLDPNLRHSTERMPTTSSRLSVSVATFVN